MPCALRYDGNWRVHHANDAMARITAERLIQHLERSGFVLMRRKTLRSADDSYQAVIARLTGDRRPRGLPHPYPTGSLPDLNPPAVGLLPRCCNRLFVGVALDIDRVGNAVLAVEEIQAVVRHSLVPFDISVDTKGHKS